MGLRGINITLLEKSCKLFGHSIYFQLEEFHLLHYIYNPHLGGHPVQHSGNSCNYQDDDDDYDYYDHRPFPGEEINYNEHFCWADPWGQGRLDFGIYGGKFDQEFRAAKYRGCTIPNYEYC